MNFAFSDISSNFVSILTSDTVQNNISQGLSLKKSDSGFPEYQFEKFTEKLSSVMQNPSSQAKEVVGGDSEKSVREKFFSDLNEELSDTSGKDFLLVLRHIFLMLSNNDLQDISISPEGLEILKKMLFEAGFDEKSIEDLLAEISAESENGLILFNDLFDKLFDLALEMDDGELNIDQNSDQNMVLEMSAAPFLESLLTSLRIPREKIEAIISSADKTENGLDLNILLDQLRQLQKESFLSGEYFKTDPDDNNWPTILNKMGFGTDKSDQSFFDLSQLVNCLERLRQELSMQQPENGSDDLNLKSWESNSKQADLIRELFAGMNLKSEKSRNQQNIFSEGRIKKEFQDSFLGIKDSRMKDQSGMADNFLRTSKKDRHEQNTGLKAGLQEMDVLLKGHKKGLGTEVNERSSDIKHNRSGQFKTHDQNLLTPSDIKSKDSLLNTGQIKSSAGFKNLPAHVTQQVGRSLVRAVNNGENTLRLQLKPPELGRIVMTIDNSGSNIKVNILTENSAAREILVSNSNELKTVLSNSGVNLERFEVDMNSDFRQSMADAKNHEGKFGRSKTNSGKTGIGSAAPEDSLKLEETAGSLSANSSVHYVA